MEKPFISSKVDMSDYPQHIVFPGDHPSFDVNGVYYVSFFLYNKTNQANKKCATTTFSFSAYLTNCITKFCWLFLSLFLQLE